MWKWFNCYLSGRHNFGITCEPGEIFLKCSHCGRRSPGWSVDPRFQSKKPAVQTHPKRRALPITGVAAS